MSSNHSVNLQTPLSFATAFRFPLQTSQSRKEVIIGGLLLLLPIIGWILNMGHRIMMVHQMQHGKSAWPAWKDYPVLFRHGLITFLGMVEYHLPAVVVEYFAWRNELLILHIIAGILWVVATVAVPGYMSHYCQNFDPQEIFNPFRALRRVFEGGHLYWKAWAIALTALVLSFTGLIAFGIGFLFTSVWFWQVAGYSFATVFTGKFGLRKNADSSKLSHSVD